MCQGHNGLQCMQEERLCRQMRQSTGVLRPTVGSLLCCSCWACSSTPGLDVVFCLCTYSRAHYILNAISAHVIAYSTAFMNCCGLESWCDSSSLRTVPWPYALAGQ